MTGGLLQLITSGEQDVYLTSKPEITFFRKVYKRYTNFSLDFKEIATNQQVEYGEEVSFNIENLGDGIHKCYIQITLPIIPGFSDNIITNSDYINNKNAKKSNIIKNQNTYSLLYSNLQSYIKLQTIVLRKLKTALQINNITITDLQTIIILFNNQYSQQLLSIKNIIDTNIINIIDIPTYILKQTGIIGTNITISDIINQLDTRYNNMNYWAKYYYNKLQYYNKLYSNITNTNNINFNWAEYLGHNFFEYFRLEIGGIEVTSYYNDYLHINQTCSLKEEYQSNYLLMIGHDQILNNYNTGAKGGNTILIPLLFWFCKDAGSVLPLIALQYQTVTITVKLNKLKNIICFENWEKIYDDLLNISSITFQDLSNTTINNDLLSNQNSIIFQDLSAGTINLSTARYANTVNIDTKLPINNYIINFQDRVINYKCMYINYRVLLYNFPQLQDSDINFILNTYGIPNNSQNNTSSFSNNIMYLDQWIYFMTQLPNLIGSQYININNLGLYYPYINYNLLYSQIPVPNISLICQFVYFDEIERKKFATSKLEYVIETIEQNIYDVNKISQSTFNCDLSFTKPTKEFFWYIQPKIFNIGLSSYGQNTQLLFNYRKYYNAYIIKEQSFTLDQYNIIKKNEATKYNPNITDILDYNDESYNFNVLPYKYLSNNLPLGVYYHTFSLYPEETQPSGTANLSIIKAKEYNVTFNTDFINEYFNNSNTNNLNPNKQGLLIKLLAKSYNMFIIENGHGGLLFTI